MKKAIIFILLAFLMLGFIGYFYVNKFLIPVKLKEVVATKSLETLQRNVTFDSMHYRPFKGFEINNIVVYQKDDPRKKFISIEKLSFNILLLPFIKEHKVVVPYVRIIKPFVNISRYNNGTWSFSDLIKPKQPSSTTAPSVLPASVEIRDATFIYNDLTKNETIRETITQLSVKASLSLTKGVAFQGEFKLPDYTSAFAIKGHYDLNNKDLQTQLEARHIPIAHLSKRYSKNPRLQIPDGHIQNMKLSLFWKDSALSATGEIDATKLHLIIDDDKILKSALAKAQPLTIGWTNGRLNLKGSIELTDGYFKTPSAEEITGNMQADIQHLRYNDQNLSLEGNLNLKKGRVRIDDNATVTGNLTAPQLSLNKQKAIYQIKGVWRLDNGQLQVKDRKFSASVSTDNFSLLKHDSGFALRGALNLEKAELNFSPNMQLIGNILLEDTHLTFKNATLEITSPVIINKGKINLANNRHVIGNLSSPKLHLKHNQTATELNGKIALNQATFTFAPKSHFSGSPTLLVKLKNQRTSDATSVLTYDGTVKFTNAVIEGLPKVGDIHQVSGLVRYDNQKISTDALSFQYGENIWLLAGHSSGFGAPFVNVELKTQKANIQDILKFVPQMKNQFGVDAAGLTDLVLNYEGHIDRIKDANIQVMADLLQAHIESNRLPAPLNSVSGRLIYKNDNLRWSNLTLSYKDKNYKTTGELLDFSRPRIAAKVETDNLTAEFDLNILRQVLQFTSLRGQYFNSRFNVASDVALKENAPPEFYVKGSADLDLRDLIQLPKSISTKLQPLSLQGRLQLDQLLFKGTLQRWRHWELTFNGSSPRITIKETPLSHITIAYGQRDQYISEANLNGQIYDGNVNVTAKADIRTNKISSDVTASLQSMNLAVLAQERDLKKKDLAGIVNAGVSLKGDMLQPRSMTGDGLIVVRDGYLWEWKILKGLLSALLIPEFKQASFTEARIPFNIKEGKIVTEQAQVTGKTLDLTAHGWLDMNKDINFVIIPKFSEIEFLQSSSTLKKIPTSLFTQTQGYISINVTGSLTEPKYKVDTFPGKIIEKTTIFLKEGIQGIFEEIF